MLKRASAWTILGACLMLMLPGCSSKIAANESAICDGTEAARTDHAAALAQDGGDLSVVTGATLIQKIDAACG